MWSAGEVCSADADGDCYMLTSGGVIIKRRNYDDSGPETRSERGNLAKLRRCQFANLIRYQFGPQHLTPEEFAQREPIWNAEVLKQQESAKRREVEEQRRKLERQKRREEGGRQRPAPFPFPVAATPSVGRNQPCPCGSGRKFKKCCGP